MVAPYFFWEINMTIRKEIEPERKFNSGAKRQAAAGKGTPVLFPGDAYLDICKHFEDGAVHYGGRNWERGLPLSSYIDSLERHIAQEKMGLTDESHDRAIAWNAICYLATKLRIQAGILPKELDDLCGVYGDKPVVEDKFAEYCIAQNPQWGWYINQYDSSNFLWKDLELHDGTCDLPDDSPYGEAPGYYHTKEIAETYLQVYLDKEEIDS